MNSITVSEFPLQCGVVLPSVQLVYQIHGEFRRDRVILYPTSYGAQHRDVDWLIHPQGILNPECYCIIQVNMLGNGLSTSPSNCDACGMAEQGCWFTHWDNIRLQAHLLFQVLQIERLVMVYGWSMGAQQGYHWAACYPERVARLVALCGTARTTEHNQLFLQSLRLALTGDPTWNGHGFDGIPERGLKTFTHIYASWAASQTFYRQQQYRNLGYDTLQDYIAQAWEANYRRRDPRDLIAMIDTWLHCDVSNNPLYQGDYAAALGAITAKTLVMPSSSDLYFTPEDCAAEAQQIPGAIYQPIASIWGHRAGNPYQNPADADQIRTAVQSLLADEPPL